MTPEVSIFCDGSGTTNQKPCGFAAILRFGEIEKEITGSLDAGTNNVAELMACIIALEALKKPCKITVHSDSEYLILGITQGRAFRWRRNGWRKKKLQPKYDSQRRCWNGNSVEMMDVPNANLWERLLNALEPHKHSFIWVRGHNGHTENERCDKLAGQARINHQLQTA